MLPFFDAEPFKTLRRDSASASSVLAAFLLGASVGTVAGSKMAICGFTTGALCAAREACIASALYSREKRPDADGAVGAAGRRDIWVRAGEAASKATKSFILF